MLLAIDTSAGTSVAILDDGGRVLAERTSDDTRGHAERIGILMDDVLTAAGVEPAAVTEVAVGMGPGPFTGLRVGIAAARVFAFGLGVPVRPVVSHDAIAHAHLLAHPDAQPFRVVTDARRRELAVSRYERGPRGLAERSDGPHLVARDAIDAGCDLVEQPVSAAALAALVLARREAGEEPAVGAPDAPAEPLYLRPPDVTISATNASARRVS